jgi:hypothetical protein
MKTPHQIEAELNQFTGATTLYKHWLKRSRSALSRSTTTGGGATISRPWSSVIISPSAANIASVPPRYTSLCHLSC